VDLPEQMYHFGENAGSLLAFLTINNKKMGA